MNKRLLDVSTKKTKVLSEDEEDEIVSQNHKRRRIIVDSDSDRENDSNNIKDLDKTSNSEKVYKTEQPPPSSPVAKKKIKIENSFEEKLQTIKHDENEEIKESDETVLDDEPVIWTHNKLDFLKPGNIKDIKGRKMDHPDYDPTTLHVPKSYLESLSPVKYPVMLL